MHGTTQDDATLAAAQPFADGRRYAVAHLTDIDPVKCPCGWTRRAFTVPENPTATIHLVEIAADARTHYHKKLTEIYLILDVDESKGPAYMELDGERVPVKPLTAIHIKPGCRHRAVGHMRIVNIPVPAFDPSDEHFD